jgi:hypothetical protein
MLYSEDDFRELTQRDVSKIARLRNEGAKKNTWF